MSQSAGAEIPEGFAPLETTSPFVNLVGPLYSKPVDGRPVLGLRVEERHLNTRGVCHGGLLVALADTALGYVLSRHPPEPKPVLSVSLTTDFADSARLGEWVEARVDVQKVGARLAFANCYLHVGARRILRASGVFAVVRARPAGRRP